MKTCKGCGESKHLDLFYPSNINKDGHRGKCILCWKKQNKVNYDPKRSAEASTNWARNNRQRSREIKAKHQKESLACRLRLALRNRLYYALNRNAKTASTMGSLGCSVPELIKHLESQFESGMTWDNWTVSGWHIDHIKPLALFDLTNLEQYAQACNYKNLRPMWAKQNLSKGKKYAA